MKKRHAVRTHVSGVQYRVWEPPKPGEAVMVEFDGVWKSGRVLRLDFSESRLTVQIDDHRDLGPDYVYFFTMRSERVRPYTIVDEMAKLDDGAKPG